MVNEYRGTTEIATLYLTPDYRKDGNGRLLSRIRFLMMAEFPERFSKQVMAEMRGVSDESGHSVFWDSLGRHFFDMDFSKADYLSSLGKYQFIADLMPKFPIYVRLLPKKAQAVIGVTHAATRPALELLRREGFRFEGCVDIFDAGPTIHAPTEHIRSISESRRPTLERIVDHIDAGDMIICNARADDFRGCRGRLRETPNGSAWITRDIADALGLQLGDPLRYVRF
jgi:arginine N-succinyltransferase